MSESFEEACYKRAKEVAELVIKKQKDYGKKNITDNPFGSEIAIGVRMYDKFARFAHLKAQGLEPENETMQDTILDIMGYALVLTLVINKEFELPLKKDKDIK